MEAASPLGLLARDSLLGLLCPHHSPKVEGGASGLLVQLLILNKVIYNNYFVVPL